MMTSPVSVALVPESAPFSAEQRAWLNGFFAGMFGLGGNAAPTAPAPLPAASSSSEPDEPWHDPALDLDERMKLAEGRPLPQRLMASMAQLDCGTCGYLCRTYAQALADGKETSPTLCSPGGKDTARTIKQLLNGRAAPAATPATPAAKPAPSLVVAHVARSRNLNGPDSAKHTQHVEIDLNGSATTYSAGDALGVHPTNCPELVADVVAELGGDAELFRERSLADVPDELLSLLGEHAATPSERSEIGEMLAAGGPPDGWDVLDILRRFSTARPPAPEVAARLSPLQPRLYSISSSPKKHSNHIHLTVARVEFEHNGRRRKGVTSTMLSDRLRTGDDVRVFVRPSHDFAPPADPDAAIIMVGPGTGIAPFRGFLHDRDAVGAKGKSWLFFGDQTRTGDFLYEDELQDFLRRGILTRLDLAFSRDQAEKVYVQHRMLEHGAELYRWLEDGAYFYVCGDAKRMAKDVDNALLQIIQTHGVKDADTARAYVKHMTKTGRYARDVY